MTKQDILEWYCRSGSDISPCKTIKCARYRDLSAMLEELIDEIVDSAYDQKKEPQYTATGQTTEVIFIKTLADWKREAKQKGKGV